MLIICLLFTLTVKTSKAQLADSSSKNYKPYIITSINAATYFAGLSYLQFVWYKDYETVPFNFYNDLDGWLQMDKTGHVFSSYFINKNVFHLYKYSGLSHEKSLLYSGISAFMYMTPIEVFDGFYEGYGFSSYDIVANTLGSALFLTQHAIWQNEPIKLKFSYSESGYNRYHPYNLGKGEMETFFLDYNGHTYWLSANLNDLGIKLKPLWLNLAIGYSANGMLAEFKNPDFYKRNPIPVLPRYRQFYISPDIDLEKINIKNRTLKTVLYAINFIKIPLPALEINNQDKIKWHWLYF
ncbi:MAG: DUF2279 domain-containing protein [Bacteroidia bacterium]